ncbi:MAG: 4-hydroxyphenylpyruvate dioxygenase [SAR324 cluster bacterium]|nr:4-hydroxyphenylpyruvate dioxygenase [SAR324 cluster bacterium]
MPHQFTSEISPENPMGTDGFEFVEYASPNPEALERLFVELGFRKVGKHRSKEVFLFRQGDIHFILNAEPQSQAEQFSDEHGPSVNAIAFRVQDAAHAYRRALSLGAKGVESKVGPMELNIPAIEGIGGSLIYLVDRYGQQSIYDVDFLPLPEAQAVEAQPLLTHIDHLTHNVRRGQMEVWSDFYERLFNFKELRSFDIEGKLTGLKSKAMTSPCGKIRIPINESSDDKSQIEEYLREYKGEGIQHIAFGTGDICWAVRELRGRGVEFQNTPDTYYERVDERVPNHGEDIEQLRELRVLIDGAPVKDEGLLLQIFTTTVIGPIFYEIIQRKGNEGFGEGNFQALFESIELDQIRRGVI